MAKEFKLPDLGEGVHEGEVLAVPVSVGQEVTEGDIILEVETDKAAVEIPSPVTGIVQEILVKSGDIVTVGQVLMIFSVGAEQETEKPDAARRGRAHRTTPGMSMGCMPSGHSTVTVYCARRASK